MTVIKSWSGSYHKHLNTEEVHTTNIYIQKQFIPQTSTYRRGSYHKHLYTEEVHTTNITYRVSYHKHYIQKSFMPQTSTYRRGFHTKNIRFYRRGSCHKHLYRKCHWWCHLLHGSQIESWIDSHHDINILRTWLYRVAWRLSHGRYVHLSLLIIRNVLTMGGHATSSQSAPK